jgi:DNA-binding winged helix-turn-helix (wHTH) protein/tetratricopeptide (TPR) repeat protein
LSRDQQTFLLGDWAVDPASGELRRDDETRRLEPRVVEVLLCLVDAGGRVVSKDEIFATVWGDVAVTDDVLRRCIYNLRSTLDDDPHAPRFIRTLPRRGYQLVATVSYPPKPLAFPSSTLEPAAQPATPTRPARPTRRWHIGLAAAAAVALALGGVLFSKAATPNAPGWRPGDRAAAALADTAFSPATAEDYFDLAIRFAGQRGGDDLERAIELFSKSLELDADNARTHAELANAYALSVHGFYRDLSRFDLAIEHATIALGLDPTVVEANKALGLAFVGKGWRSSAAREYERALELRPDYQAVINNLAIIEISRGNLVRALELQRKLDDTPSLRALHLNNLGHTHRLLGDLTTARRLFDASLDVMPNNALATANLAIIEVTEGDAAAARVRVEDVVPLYPNDAPFLATAGLVELRAGNPLRAEELFHTSADLSAHGTNPRAWLGIAYLALRRGDTEAAEQIFSGFYDFAEESRRLRREYWAPYYNLTAIHAMSGRGDEAIDQLRGAIDHGFVDVAALESWPFFRTLHDDPRYQAIVADLRARIARMRNEVRDSDAP